MVHLVLAHLLLHLRGGFMRGGSPKTAPLLWAVQHGEHNIFVLLCLHPMRSRACLFGVQWVPPAI